MNYPIPQPQSTNLAYFYVNNTNHIGSFTKPIDGMVSISVDYSKVVPSVVPSSVWFEIEPGGEPRLTIDSSTIVGNVLTFLLGGGRPDTYTVTINMLLASGEVHSDYLIVNVIGDDEGCECGLVNPSQTNMLTGTGEVFVNSFPRFFVSNVAPTNANLLDRWYNTDTHQFFDYVTDGITDFWALSGDVVVPPDPGGGLPPPGSGTSGNISIKKMNPLPLDGTTNVFALTTTDSVTPNITSDNALFVSEDGVWQEPTVQYTAAGNVITFAVPPAVDSYIFILWIFGGTA